MTTQSHGHVHLSSLNSPVLDAGDVLARNKMAGPARTSTLRRPLDAVGSQPACDTLALVLAGGCGHRMKPLTDWRAKPSIPIGGRFRILDFTLSNCMNSGIRQVGVLTQYLNDSLRPALRSWAAIPHAPTLHILSPGDTHPAYQGTADAVWQNRQLLRALAPTEVLVLAADHVYAMDYGVMIAEHRRAGAQVTVGYVSVPRSEASSFGVLSVDPAGRICRFTEKPQSPKAAAEDPGRALASMGIYVFDTEFLLAVLADDANRVSSSHDFGHDIIPASLTMGQVHAHRFRDRHQPMKDGYWRDVGTLGAYWRTCLELADPTCLIDLEDPSWPLHSSLMDARRWQRASDHESACRYSVVPRNAMLALAHIERSILFPGARVGWGCRLNGCIVLPGASIGSGSTLRHVIVEEGCTLPSGTIIGLDHHADRRRYRVTDENLVVVSRRPIATDRADDLRNNIGATDCPASAVDG